MDNFAKWYAFYRTRVQANQAAAGIAFSALDQTSRVGFHTLWENGTLFTNIADFTTANKQTWFTKLYAVAPNNGTPLPDAVWRIGELFSGNMAATGLPGATDPLSPVTGKCQPNYHLLSTDGYWNSVLSYASRGDDDKTVPSLSNLPGPSGFSPTSQFPRPYYEGPTASSNSLADLAMLFWNPRPPALGARSGDKGPVRALAARHAIWPFHRRQGTVPFTDAGLKSITDGTLNWPTRPREGQRPSTIFGTRRSTARPVLQSAERATIGGRHGERRSPSSAIPLAPAQASGSPARSSASRTSSPTRPATSPGLWGDVEEYALDIVPACSVDAAGIR